MNEFFSQAWQMLIGRTTGPLTMRLILQPTVAAFLAIRAGLKDARAGRSPFLWKVAGSPSERSALLRGAWKDIGKVTVMAVVLDAVYQIIEFRWIYVVQTLIVAMVLAIVPYLVVRGLTTRLAGAMGPGRGSSPPSSGQ